MQNILFVVSGKYSEEIAEKLAFLHIHCENTLYKSKTDSVINYLETAMKNKATEMAVSTEEFGIYSWCKLKGLSEKYNYKMIEIQVTGDEDNE